MEGKNLKHKSLAAAMFRQALKTHLIQHIVPTNYVIIFVAQGLFDCVRCPLSFNFHVSLIFSFRHTYPCTPVLQSSRPIDHAIPHCITSHSKVRYGSRLELCDDQTSNQKTFSDNDASGSLSANLLKSIWRLQTYILIVVSSRSPIKRLACAANAAGVENIITPDTTQRDALLRDGLTFKHATQFSFIRQINDTGR